jgi:hypothetical protein
LSASQHHDWVVPLALEMGLKLRMQTLSYGLPRLCTDYDNTYVHQSQELMKAVESHDNLSLLFLMKGDGLRLCEQLS